MQARHQVSKAAIELIKRFEGYREHAAQLPDGRWTLGYGHTLTAREGAFASEPDAEALLMYDLIAVARAVNDLVLAPLNQNQFDALCAFAFNIGLENFRRSTVLKLINQGQPLRAACAMELWRRAEFQGESMVLDALVRRRAAEKALFLTPPEGFIPAPSPILPPHVDVEAAAAVPKVAPAVVETPLDGEPDRLVLSEPGESEGEPEAPPEAEPAGAPPPPSAESLIARLEKILAQQPAPEAFPQTAEPSLPAPEARGADLEPLILQDAIEAPPAALHAPEPAPAAEPEPAGTAPLAEVLEPVAEGGVLPPPEAVEKPSPASPPTVRTAARGKVAGLVGLALIGVALLGGGVWWMFNHGSPEGGVFGDGWLGWVVGIAGVLILAGAAYVLLDLLGRADEELDQLEE